MCAFSYVVAACKRHCFLCFLKVMQVILSVLSSFALLSPSLLRLIKLFVLCRDLSTGNLRMNSMEAWMQCKLDPKDTKRGGKEAWKRKHKNGPQTNKHEFNR